MHRIAKVRYRCLGQCRCRCFPPLRKNIFALFVLIWLVWNYATLTAILLWTSLEQQHPYDYPTTTTSTPSALHFLPLRNISMAVCLLIKDENNNLGEWIAYHSFSLPLRHLVVAVDPHSMTSPSEILSRWTALGMDIVEWNDTDYIKSEKRYKVPLDSPLNDTMHIRSHRLRQNLFVSACLGYHKAQNRTWVLTTDVDEFLTFNTVTEHDHPYYFCKTKSAANRSPYAFAPNKCMPFEALPQMQKNIVNRLSCGKISNRSWNLPEERMIARTRLPNNEMWNVTVMEVLTDQVRYNISWWELPCLVIPRIQYGSSEETDLSKLYRGIPEGFDPKKFNTLRFFRHHSNAIKGNLWHGKALVDVSRIPVKLFTRPALSIHNPVGMYCGTKGVTLQSRIISPLTANHYVGSYEAFRAKTDKRRTIQVRDTSSC